MTLISDWGMGDAGAGGQAGTSVGLGTWGEGLQSLGGGAAKKGKELQAVGKRGALIWHLNEHVLL